MEYLVLVSLLVLITMIQGYTLRNLIFLVVISCTIAIGFYTAWMREEWKGKGTRKSDQLTNWKLAEGIIRLLLFAAFVILAVLRKFSEHAFYGYFNISLIGVLAGSFLGELFWRKKRLPQLEAIDRQRYWCNLSSSIIF